jgi:hypothetical protein
METRANPAREPDRSPDRSQAGIATSDSGATRERRRKRWREATRDM